jgi:hypothetical protein
MKKIDIFNLSTYLRRTGDNKLARIGHVNALVEEINSLKKQLDLLTINKKDFAEKPVEKPVDSGATARNN